MEDTGATVEKAIRLRYAGSCRVCGTPLDAGTRAVHERRTRTVRCLSHLADAAEPTWGSTPEEDADEAVASGHAGASARREFERRREARDRRIRGRFPHIGGLVLALSSDPPSTQAWDAGALGEERLGRALDRLAGDDVRLLHDRRIPRSRANVDHLVVTTNGVWVVDAKRYRGRPSRRVEGGVLRPRVEKLLVAGRDRTSLVDGALRQVDLVRSLVGDEAPVRGVLCFLEADWPLIGGAFSVRGVEVCWPRTLYPRLTAVGDVTPAQVDRIHRTLAAALPRA
ncbi:NERD domain-containing protein [Nocardioidaceae bacterium]|nr:NERD domain-containing protein [Nocardioidaceae bacterium]